MGRLLTTKKAHRERNQKDACNRVNSLGRPEVFTLPADVDRGNLLWLTRTWLLKRLARAIDKSEVDSCQRQLKIDQLSARRFPAAVATPPKVWRLCCRRFVVSRRGRGGVRCRPNVSGSWSCGNEGGASSPRPARLVCLGPPPTTGRAATRGTAMARSWASCRRWSDWPCDGSAQGLCRRRNGSRSPTFATPG